MEKPKTKVKIDFNEPHITYRLKNGTPVVGVTTALGELNKPALPIWGFNTGREPRFNSITEAAVITSTELKKLKKAEAVSWAFGVGQQRKNASLYEKVDKAANIGTIAHAILQERERGNEIDNSNITPDNWAYALECVKSHDKWFEGMNIETIFVEKAFVSEQYRYGGTLDKYAMITGEETLIDYKSGKDIYDEYFFQLIAYCMLAIENGFPVKRAIIVNMPKTRGDNFKIQSYNFAYLLDNGYFDVFLNSVGIYYAKKKIKAAKDVI
jgi:hypothetical protein